MRLLKVDGRFKDGEYYKGRGVPVNGMVQVHVGYTEDGSPFSMMVSEEEWRERLDYVCIHGRKGFQCKVCLSEFL